MLSADERRALSEWVAQSEQNRRHFQRQCELWASSGAAAELDRFDTEAAYRRFVRNVEADIASENEADDASDFDSSGIGCSWMRRISACAAVVIAVVALTAGAFYIGREDLKNNMADMTITAPEGSNTQVTLPDGTQVWLNSGSRLSYSQRYGLDERNVKIQGEGYFEVKRNRKLPFTVSSHDMNVRVLGTKFNFDDYPDGDKATVTLAEGKVAMRGNFSDGKEYLLAPNQRAVLNKNTGSVVIENCTAADDIQWRSGTISFEGQTLYEIAAILSKTYDMDIAVVTQHAGRKRFYGDFSRKGQSARDIVDDLCKTSDISYKVRGRRIEIR